MVTYRYEGMSASGAKVEGVIEAFDEQDAANKARENCSQVLKIEKVNTSKFNKLMHADLNDIFGGGKIKAKSLSLLCSQLGIELKAGLSLVSSLQLVAENEKDKKIKQILDDVATDVAAGHGLADSFQLRGEGLPNSFIETVRAGEESGRLDESFDRLKVYYEDQAAVNSKVKSAMVYPIMLICVAVLVIGIIMIFAVPVFKDTFASMGNELPFPTKALIAISDFMTNSWYILLAFVLAIAISISLIKKTDKGAHFFARLKLTIPGIKGVNQMKAASQFASTMATMMASGLPIVRSVNITANTMDNLLIKENMEEASKGVLEGNRLSDGLRKSPWLPNLLVEMTSVGEETGKLEETLNVVTDYYNKEVSTAVARALEIMNPCITIVLALIVVFILLSVYLPIFSMYGGI